MENEVKDDEELCKALRHRAGLRQTCAADAYVMLKAEQRIKLALRPPQSEDAGADGGVVEQPGERKMLLDWLAHWIKSVDDVDAQMRVERLCSIAFASPPPSAPPPPVLPEGFVLVPRAKLEEIEDELTAKWHLIDGEWGVSSDPPIEADPIIAYVRAMLAASPQPEDARTKAMEAGAIRICPRRDGPCPHGASCTYWQHDMDCSTEPSSTPKGDH
jgi:hypothetical protein